MDLDDSLKDQLISIGLSGGDAVTAGFLVGIRGKAAVYCVSTPSQSIDAVRAHANDVRSRLCGGFSIVGMFAAAAGSPPQDFSSELHALVQAAVPDGSELLVGGTPLACVWSGKSAAPQFAPCLSQLRGFTSVVPVNVCLPLSGGAAARRAAVDAALEGVADALRGGYAQPAGAADGGFTRLRIFSPGLSLGTNGGVCSTEVSKAALSIRGHVHARAYADAKSIGSSFESAAEALREDVSRTLQTRFALLAGHAPLMGGTVQLPQRVLVPVGAGQSPQLLVSDYRLPGETLAACQQRVSSVFAIADLDAASCLTPESAAPAVESRAPKASSRTPLSSAGKADSADDGLATKEYGGVPMAAIVVAVLGIILAMLFMR